MPDVAQQVFASLLRPTTASGSAQRFVVIPGTRMPRWLLPSDTTKLHSLLRSWSPYRLSSRIAWYAVRAADRLGGLPGIPGINSAEVTGFDQIDWTTLGWRGPDNPIVAAYVGTPGPVRKAVLHLLDSSGTCAAIVKLPLVEGAKSSIVREAGVLKRLESQSYPFAPRLLYVDRQCGISTQTAMNGRSGEREINAGIEQLLRSLLLPGKTTHLAEHAAVWQAQLLWTCNSAADIKVISAALVQMCDIRPLPTCWVHGDFAPWNIKRLKDGSLALIDWEDAIGAGLPMLDPFHFLHVQDYLFGKKPHSHAAELHTFAASIGIPADSCRKLEVAYLASCYLRCLARGDSNGAGFLFQTLRIVL